MRSLAISIAFAASISSFAFAGHSEIDVYQCQKIEIIPAQYWAHVTPNQKTNVKINSNYVFRYTERISSALKDKYTFVGKCLNWESAPSWLGMNWGYICTDATTQDGKYLKCEEAMIGKAVGIVR